MKNKLKQLYGRLPLVREINEMRAALSDIVADTRHMRKAMAGEYLDQLMRNHPHAGNPQWLPRHSAQVCSQNGEDGIIQEIFRRIGTTNRVFAEIGVGDGKENNTAFLLGCGWTGFWIDGDDAFTATLRRRPDLDSPVLKWKVALVDRENVCAHFDELGVPADLDLLSLDIDQNTYYVWEALAAKFRARALVIEYNGSIPPQVEWKVNYSPERVWDNSQNYSASLKALENLGRRLGYHLVGCDLLGVNAFFVREDLTGDHFMAPFTAENHYQRFRLPLIHRDGHRNNLLDREG